MSTAKLYSLSSDELRALQMVLLGMLIELDSICKKHGIKYSIFAGTLLGSVRHKGFIPWDDDLDVAMTRPEYEKFRNACKRDLDDGKYFFQDNTTDPYYRWGYARLLRRNTRFVRMGQEHMRAQNGVFLDIFVMDGVPKFAPLRGLHNFYCFILRKLLYAEAGRKATEVKCLRMCYIILNLVPRNWTFRRLEKLTIICKTSNLVRHLTFPMPKGRKYGFCRSWFEELEDYEFEGHTFPGIKDYESFLVNHYGDYMQIPPLEMRRWHPVSNFSIEEI